MITRENKSRTVSWDDIYHLLSSPRRRMVVEILGEDPSWDLGELATEMARRENGEEPSSQQRKTVYVSLYQTHIEKLEDHGVLVWDLDNNEVIATDYLEKIAAIHRAGKEVCDADTEVQIV